jgi:3-hydroxybutyryl-CoA dehydratase
MTQTFETVDAGFTITGGKFSPTRETIREFCEASLDHNPLHLDEEYMKGSFGKTTFGGIIMHGMTHFGLMTKMLTDWLSPIGGIHRRLETRWLIPVKPGDTIQPTARVRQKKQTTHTGWIVLDLEMRNQRGELVARGESLAEFPPLEHSAKAK